MCRLPVNYAVGNVDERFGVTKEEAKTALLDAEAVWEKALGREDIFNYTEEGPYRVNFIYDERQRKAEASQRAKSELAKRGGANEVLVELHKKLVEEYAAYEIEYNAKVSSYEKEQAKYNAEVERYNASGGAPPDAYKSLETKRAKLDQELGEINTLAKNLEGLVEQINSIGSKGNELIDEYNNQVDSYNNTFAYGHEYTQGDYQARDINVYSFTSKAELVLVLSHELGHTLAITHVQDPASIMYYLMGEQTIPAELSTEDVQAFQNVCESGFVSRLLGSVRTLYNGVINK